MLHDSAKICTTRRVWDEHHAEEVSGFRGDVIGEGEGSIHDVLIQQVDIIAIGIGRVIVERKVPCKHGIQYDTA